MFEISMCHIRTCFIKQEVPLEMISKLGCLTPPSPPAWCNLMNTLQARCIGYSMFKKKKWDKVLLCSLTLDTNIRHDHNSVETFFLGMEMPRHVYKVNAPFWTLTDASWAPICFSVEEVIKSQLDYIVYGIDIHMGKPK